MTKDELGDILRWPFSRKARKRLATRPRPPQCRRLFMTLVVRDEADTIEKSIRFHHAMGVDGFVVSSHNSKDATNAILDRLAAEGLVKRLFVRTTPDHRHGEWVNEMVRCAGEEFGADWVINADGDEFYYSEALDLKKSINACEGANALWIDSTFLFPDDKPNFFESTYFVTRPLRTFEAEQAGVAGDPAFADFIESQGCTKVIHRTSGFLSVTNGNHDVSMMHRIKCHAGGIRLYHYHVRNYAGYEGKVRRWMDSARLMPEGQCAHLKHMVALYECGQLREDYDRRYSAAKRQRLIELGVVAHDPSVRNFMAKEGLL